MAINYKHHAFPDGTAVYDVERGQLAGIREEFWQTDTSVARNSWCYTENNDYKDPGDLIGDLVDIVSKNGAMLLNIGPRADGTIPEQDAAVLEAIGAWLLVYGEAVYGTRPWKVFGEGPTAVVEGSFSDTKRQRFTAEDIRFTTRESLTDGKTTTFVYATALAVPDDRRMRITSLGRDARHAPGEIVSVSLIRGRWRDEAPLEFEWLDGCLDVRLPDELPSEHAVSVRIAIG